jgi:hypothetical protein
MPSLTISVYLSDQHDSVIDYAVRYGPNNPAEIVADSKQHAPTRDSLIDIGRWNHGIKAGHHWAKQMP